MTESANMEKGQPAELSCRGREREKRLQNNRKKMRTKISLFDEIGILSCWIIPASFCLPGWEGYRVGGGGNGVVFRTFWKAFGTLWGSLGVLEGFHGPMVKVLFLVIVMVPVIMTHGHGQ